MLTPLLVAFTCLPPMLPVPAVAKDWPLGQPVPVTHQNNGSAPSFYFACEPNVFDAQGQVVRYALCSTSPSWLLPGETWTAWWDQRDQSGNQVPPGTYVVDGNLFRVGGTEVGIAALGAPHMGSARQIAIHAREAPHAAYLLAASFSSTSGIALGCGHALPLDADVLLSISLSNSPMFVDFAGTLDANGRTAAPTIVLPEEPWMVGIGFDLAAVLFDPGLPCGVRDVSGVEHVTVR